MTGLYSVSYNIAPSQNAFLVCSTGDAGDKRNLKQMKWGLVPSWTKPGKSENGLINARFETITEKPSFRNSYKSRRCIIPASGFFEWKKDEKHKIPYFISMGRDSEGDIYPMFICGIYDSWISGEGKEIQTFAIITREAAEGMKNIHERMPLIITGKNIPLWLGKDYNHEMYKDLILSFDAKSLKIDRVSEFVNSPVNNSSQCIIPAGD